jgi:integrase
MLGTLLGSHWRNPAPKIAEELSPAKVRALMNKPGLHAVGGVNGLLLQVSRGKSGQLRRSWILRAVVGAKRRDFGLGSYPSVTVGIARDRARELREQIRAGSDPTEERRKARAELIASQVSAMTFKQCAESYIKAHQAAWKNPKHPDQWRNTLRDYAFPILGDLPWNEIETPHVLRVLEPIWTVRTETASRVRGRIESILDWAKVRYGNDNENRSNPARWRGHLAKLLPGKSNVAPVEHHEALPYQDVPAFMAELRKRDGIAARCLEFTILTWARSGAARGARWDEVDWQARTWTIPPHRNKGRKGAGKPHIVPLSDAALELLRALPRTSDLIFPAPRGGQLSDMALTMVLRRMKVDVTAHGFRSSAKDWASEMTSHADIVSEMALAHTVSDEVKAAYRRGDLLEKRRRLLRDWAKFVGTVQPVSGKIISLQVA